MTIFSDEVLMLTAAEMEEWYERELINRGEMELRQRRIVSRGGPTTAPGPPTLDNFVGFVPANFNFLITNQNFSSSSTTPAYQPNFSATAINPVFNNNTAWGFGDLSVATSTAQTPDGQFTAWHLVEDNQNSTHLLGAFGSGATPARACGVKASGVKWRVAGIAQAAERTRCVLQIIAQRTGTGAQRQASVGFDIKNGQTGYDNSVDAGWTINATSITRVASTFPGVWWLCIFDATFALQTPLATEDIHWVQTLVQVFVDAGSGTAARNVTYQGNGAAGINLWWMNLLPAGAWQLNTTTFFDDFTSFATVDLLNVGDPSKNWFLHNDWSQNWNQVNGTAWFGAPTMPTSALTQSGSILSLGLDPSSNNYGAGIMSVFPTGTPPGVSFIGKTFTMPMIVECCQAFDTTLADGYLNPPGTWAQSIEILAQQPLGWGFCEIAFTGANNNYCHCTGTYLTLCNANVNGASSLANFDLITNFNFLQPQRLSCMLLPAALNDGSNGVAFWFCNGLYCAAQSSIGGQAMWSRNSPLYAINGSQYNGPNGTFVQAESQRFPIFINAQGSPARAPPAAWPQNVDYIRVIQLPTGNKTFPIASINLVHASNQFLNQTSGSSPSNNLIFTIGMWIKRATVSDVFFNELFTGNNGAAEFRINTTNTLSFGAAGFSVLSTTTVADTNFHAVCLAVDTTQATAANRVHIYVDGVEVGYDGTTTYPAQNSSTGMNEANALQTLGAQPGFTRSFNGSIAFFYFVDGRQLDPTFFGTISTGTITGYHPYLFTNGSFGNNGSYLAFGTFDGTDSSGNGRNWTLQNNPLFSSAVPS